MIRAFAGQVPVLGVCLGHQSMVEVFGGKVVRAGRLMHGKTSVIQHDGRGLFAGLPQPCEVGRYHSLIAAPETLPRSWKSAPGQPKARSWECVIVRTWWRGCSFIRKAS